LKVFDEQTNGIGVGQKVGDFRVGGHCLSDLEGSPLLFVFWKTL